MQAQIAFTVNCPICGGVCQPDAAEAAEIAALEGLLQKAGFFGSGSPEQFRAAVIKSVPPVDCSEVLLQTLKRNVAAYIYILKAQIARFQRAPHV